MSITTLEPSIETATSSETPLETPDSVAGIYWTLNEAARKTGGNKGTISRHIAEGKLQWHDRPEGRRLHAAEVLDFYGDRIKKRRNTVAEQAPVTSLEPITNESNTPQPSSQQLENAMKLAAAETEIRLLREMLDQERDRREKAEQEQDRWHKAYDEMKLLPPPPAPQTLAAMPVAAPQNPTEPRGFWDRVFGR